MLAETEPLILDSSKFENKIMEHFNEINSGKMEAVEFAASDLDKYFKPVENYEGRLDELYNRITNEPMNEQGNFNIRTDNFVVEKQQLGDEVLEMFKPLR